MTYYTVQYLFTCHIKSFKSHHFTLKRQIFVNHLSHTLSCILNKKICFIANMPINRKDFVCLSGVGMLFVCLFTRVTLINGQWP